MRIVLLSDTHSQHDQIEVPPGDLLIHAGDICGPSKMSAVEDFARFLGSLDFAHKIIVAGNHDWPFDRDEERERAETLIADAGATYLNDEGYEVDGVQIWGSPIQPWFMDWAFNRRRGPDIQQHWDMIPQETDLLITHGPPFGIMDKIWYSGASVGCQDLLRTVEHIQPKLHVFGHIHEGYGQVQQNGTLYVNASNCNQRYRAANAPIVVDWETLD